jgi:putative ATP-binding cassette transporter
MSFFQLIRREMQGSLPRLVAMSGLGGLSNAAILAAINSGAQESAGSKLWSASLFLIALIIFVKTQNYILIVTTAEIEAIIHKLRIRLMDEVRRSELIPLEVIGRSEIIGAITRETMTLTQASNMLAFAAQGVVLLLFVAFYIAYLSLLAFALSAIIVGAAGVLFHLKNRDVSKGLSEAAEWERRLLERLIDLLDGFKEVRLNHARSNDLMCDIKEVSRTAANIKIRTQSETFKQLVFTQSSMYVLLGAIVFAVPAFSHTLGGDSIAKTATAVLFVVGTCFGLMQSVPLYTAANAAADNIENLEARLRATIVAAENSDMEPPKRFKKIQMHSVVFRYVDKSSEAIFQVGPVDFTLQSGDLVFITGGNGSGKSTFLKVLSGLFSPDLGKITLDGASVDNSRREAYRTLITAIFSDYHLFHRLYGITNLDPAEVDRLLTQFRLLDKTRLTKGEFETLDLSGGQRKRLALIVGLLEKRPILLLDEWTADQDPEYRRKFYRDVLPALKEVGATVVVVTHDERYLDELKLPARRLRMDEGLLVEQHSVENNG